tara:strand:- start:603 stop:1088 length:486 start_codon:yes stop_codon:yes gene_type:complete
LRATTEETNSSPPRFIFSCGQSVSLRANLNTIIKFSSIIIAFISNSAEKVTSKDHLRLALCYHTKTIPSTLYKTKEKEKAPKPSTAKGGKTKRFDRVYEDEEVEKFLQPPAKVLHLSISAFWYDRMRGEENRQEKMYLGVFFVDNLFEILPLFLRTTSQSF